MIYLGLIPIVAALDNRLKDGIETQDEDDLPQNIWHDRITLTRMHNNGLMFNILQDDPQTARKASFFGTMLSALMMIPIVTRSKSHSYKVGGSLVVAGAVSNLYDRIKRGHVVDYIRINKGPFKKLAFNLGDLSIFTGGILMFLGSLKGSIR